MTVLFICLKDSCNSNGETNIPCLVKLDRKLMRYAKRVKKVYILKTKCSGKQAFMNTLYNFLSRLDDLKHTQEYCRAIPQ